jgi:hypothetical protein
MPARSRSGLGLMALSVILFGSAWAASGATTNPAEQPAQQQGVPDATASSATSPAGDAAVLYNQASSLIDDNRKQNIESPAASNSVFREYPPFGDEWTQMEKANYEASGDIRALVRQATAINHAAWPVRNPANHNFSYLNNCRGVANNIGDGALYQSLVLPDQPVAFNSIGDLLHLSDLLKNQPGENLIRLLVGDGIQAMAMYRLMVITSDVPLTNDPARTHDLPVASAEAWVTRLLNQPTAQAEFDQVMKGEPAGSATNPILQPSLKMVMETIRRSQAERDFAAMSLAAHVYKFKEGRWPASIAELATELPALPLDSWGDGKQTLGYLLVKGGMPDGSDRPLVYSRSDATDGLFFRTDIPRYFYYNRGGPTLPAALRKLGGQFRDVAHWADVPGGSLTPTTKPVP